MSRFIHKTIWLIAAASTLFASDTFAQSVCLPAPRLLTTMPMGGQVGTEVEVTVTGELLEGPVELLFSTPQITATAKPNEDGKPDPKRFVVLIAEDCPTGIHEARVMTGWGLSSSRIFSVNDLTELVQTDPSSSIDTAMALSVNSICNATIPVRVVNHYRFTARKDQRLVVDCAARGIDSKLYPVVIIADDQGRDLKVERRGDRVDFTAPADGDYLIKVHELTFQGGPYFFYRLALREVVDDVMPDPLATTRNVNAASWPAKLQSQSGATKEVEPNDATGTASEAAAQKITLPCDIVGNFFPAADVDSFDFTAKKGEVWWVEVASERLGLPTDPAVVIQQIQSEKGDGEDGKSAGEKLVDIAELSDILSPVKVSTNHYTYDGPPYNAGSSDVLGKFEIREDGRYRLQLSDLYGGTRSDARNVYRLIVREAQPDFSLVGWALHMELRNGDRNVLSKPIALRPGSTMAIEVIAIRRDGFDGDIELEMSDLPEGVSAQGLKIPSGSSRGIMLVTADSEAPWGWKAAKFSGRADIDGVATTRPCRLASMAWPVKDAWSEIPSPRLIEDVTVSVGNAEPEPLTLAPESDQVWEAVAGEKLTIPLVHTRRSDFSGANISLKTLGHGFEQNAKFDVPINAEKSEAVLDLAKLKTPPGDYLIAFYGSAVAKYAPIPLDLETASDAPAKPQAKPAATKPQDIVDIIVSHPIAIRVHPAEKE